MAFLDELRQLTEEREAINDRIDAEYERRGIPRHLPLIAIIGRDNDEVNKLGADVEDLKAREAAFWAKYNDPKADYSS